MILKYFNYYKFTCNNKGDKYIANIFYRIDIEVDKKGQIRKIICKGF